MQVIFEPPPSMNPERALGNREDVFLICEYIHTGSGLLNFGAGTFQLRIRLSADLEYLGTTQVGGNNGANIFVNQLRNDINNGVIKFSEACEVRELGSAQNPAIFTPTDIYYATGATGLFEVVPLALTGFTAILIAVLWKRLYHFARDVLRGAEEEHDDVWEHEPGYAAWHEERYGRPPPERRKTWSNV